MVPSFLFTQLMSAFLRNDGDPALATKAVLFGGVFNVFGDYFFVFTLDMGIMGAGNAEQVLNEYHFDQHHRIGSGASVVMTVVRPESRSSRSAVQQALISADFTTSKQSKSRKTRAFRDFLISAAFVLFSKNLMEFDKV